MVTRSPLACNNLASEAETIPFPNDEVTPPVTNTYLDISLVLVLKKIRYPATYPYSTTPLNVLFTMKQCVAPDNYRDYPERSEGSHSSTSCSRINKVVIRSEGQQ